MMSMMDSQKIKAITSAIAEKVIPEIQKFANSMSSTVHRENESGPKMKMAKKDPRSVGDLRDTTGCGSYMVTVAIDTQPQIPEFLTDESTQSQNLERQQSNHNVSLDTTLPAPDQEVSEPSQDPFIRLGDVLVNLQNKPQFMTIRLVQTTPMTFVGKSEKSEHFEDLFHTMIKMQPAMTEQMKTNHFHPLLRKGHYRHSGT